MFNSIQYKLNIMVVLILLLTVGIVGYISISQQTKTLEQLAEEQLRHIVEQKTESGKVFLKNVESDLRFLLNVPPPSGIVRALQNNGIDPNDGSTLQQWFNRYETIFKALIQTKPEYFKIRFIDKTGQERIRVERHNNEIIARSGSDLQNDANSDFFIETRVLPAHSLYISRYDLNIENNKIEFPHRPTIRYAAPIHNAQGIFTGMVIINVDMQIFNDILTHNATNNQTYVTNTDGDLLIHPNKTQEWGFLLNNRVTLIDEWGTVARAMLSGQVGYMADLKGDLAAYVPIYFDPDNSSRFWVIIQTANRNNMLANVATFKQRFIVLLVFVIAGGVGFTLFQSQRIVRPLQNVIDAAKKIAQGDLTHKQLPVTTTDETGQLAQTFNTMLAGLQHISKQTRDAAQHLSQTTEVISNSVQNQTTSIHEQTAAIQETSTTVTEIAGSGVQIAERAQDVSASAENTAQAAQTGLKAVTDIMAAIDDIREQAETVSEGMAALGEKNRSASNIVNSVNELAEQTSLLALNAAIESAEAGEHGHRFSVVAEEMQDLAQKAREATLQVRTILEDVGEAINTSIRRTSESVRRVENGRHQTQIAEKTIRNLVSGIQDSVVAFQQIVAATNQQRIGLEQVEQALGNIDMANQQTTKNTQQLETLATDLTRMSQQIQNAVTQYKL